MCKKIFFLLLIPTILFNACKKDEEEPTPTTSTFSCKIDGNAFSTTNVQVLKAATGELTIQAFSTTLEQVILMSPNSTVGTYTMLDGFGEVSGIYQNANNAYLSLENSGSIVITSSTEKSIIGTFSFDCEDFDEVKTADVTEGKFNLVID